jgi:hypothetical protein
MLGVREGIEHKRVSRTKYISISIQADNKYHFVSSRF